MFLIAVFIAVAIACAGIWLILRSRSKVGSEPHCGHCDYQLTGLTSNRCPECGRPFIQAGVTLGRNRGTARGFWLGLSFIVFSIIYFVINQIMHYNFISNSGP